MRESQQITIPTGTESVPYVDHYKMGRQFGKHLNEAYSFGLTGNGVSHIGLITERAADIPVAGHVQIVSSDVDDNMDVTIYGLDGSDAPLTETLTLDGTNVVEGAASFKTVLGVSLSGVAEGTVLVQDTVIPTTLFSLATGVLTKGVYAVDLDITGDAIISIDTNAAVDVLVVGTDSDGAPVLERVDMTAGATPITLSEPFANVSALMLGDVAAARTVSLSGGDTQATAVPFEPAVVEAIRVGAATRMLPGPSGAVSVNMLTGDAASEDITVAAGDSGYDITLPRSLAMPGVTVYVQCFGYQDISGSS